MKQVIKNGVLFIIFGTLYYYIEIAWRGYSHWTMWLLGAVLGILIGGINEYFTEDMSLIWQGIISAICITVFEFAVGIIVNVWLGWNVWDYSQMRFQIMGQISLLYSCLWFLLSIICIVLDDYLRHVLFGEKMPKYKIQ